MSNAAANLKGSLGKKLVQVKSGSTCLSRTSHKKRNEFLKKFAELLLLHRDFIFKANKKDLMQLPTTASTSIRQRLRFDEAKLSTVVSGIHQVVGFADPVGRIEFDRSLKPGLRLQKVATPLGVVAVIFESRPDVIPQIAALMVKTGNGFILKGGREARHTNAALVSVLKKTSQAVPFDAVSGDSPKNLKRVPSFFLQLTERQEVQALLTQSNFVDLVVPRGSNAFVQEIMKKSLIPVLGHADGVCHIYLESPGDYLKALDVILNSKLQYPAACNAVETLLVNMKDAKAFLPLIYKAALINNMDLFGCPRTRKIIPKIRGVKNWHIEYGEPKLSIKIVDNISQAIVHIQKFGSKHTDCILTGRKDLADFFCSGVDSANVYWNASTRFADGYRYGFGAEIGISTSKLHARGPVGLEGLLSYKYILQGTNNLVT